MKPISFDGPEKLEKSVEIGTLCAFYGGLLTQKQQDALRLYYEEDLSLGEIADELETSRQNVHELITHSAQKLRKYEAALGSMKRAAETARELKQVAAVLQSIDGADENERKSLAEAAERIGAIIRRQEGE